MEKKAVTIQFRATCLYWLGWVVLHDQKANTELSPATSRHPTKKHSNNNNDSTEDMVHNVNQSLNIDFLMLR